MSDLSWIDDLIRDKRWWSAKFPIETDIIITPEIIPSQQEEDKLFLKQALKDIGYFHELYAKDHDPTWLEIAKNMGVYCVKIRNRLQAG